MPVVLNTEQRNQLDRNIKMMLANGASEVDVKSYASDFKNKYAVEKKSKVGSISGQASTSVGIGGDGLVPLSVDQDKFQRDKLRYEAANNPKMQLTEEEIVNDPVKAAAKIINTKVNDRIMRQPVASSTAVQKPLELRHEEKPKEGLSMSDAKKELEYINKNLFKSKEEAEQYLNQNIDKDENNITKKLAIKRFQDFEKLELALGESNSLEEAAVKLAAINGDEKVKYLLDKAGGLGGMTEESSAIPLAMRGEKLLQLLVNPDLLRMAEKNPQLKTQVKEEMFNFPNHHPEYATKLLAEMIANKRDEQGLNNAFANIVSKETTDKIVKELIEEGSLPANYQFLYEKTIRPKLGTWQSIGRGIGNLIPGLNQAVNEAPIPTPGLLENFEQGLEKTEVGIAKSILDLPSLAGLPTLTDAIQSKEQQTYNVLKKQYETPSFEPTRLSQKLSMHGGNMAAFITGLSGGTSALRAINLIKNPAMANATMMLLATHGDTSDQAKALFPRNDFKQFVYTNTMGALNAALGKYLPGQQIPRLLGQGKETVASVLKKMVDGDITTKAAKNQLLDWFSNTTKSTLRGAEFMGAISAADDSLTQLLEGKGFNFDQALEAGWEGFKLGLIATPLLAGTEAALKSNKGFRDHIIDFAERPDYYKEVAKLEGQKDPEFAKVQQDIINNIDYVSKVYQEVAGTKMSDSDKRKYVIDSLSEKVKLGKAENATDPTIKKRYQQEAKDLSEIKDAALSGIPEEKIKLNQAIRDVKELYNEDLISKGAKEMMESKESEEGKPKFDDKKVKPFLKFLAQQSNNITEDGKFDTGSDARKATEKQYPSQLIELANEMFPEYRKIAEEHESAIASEPLEKPKEGAAENVVPSTLVIKTEKDAVLIEKSNEMDVRQQTSDGEGVGKGDTQPQITTPKEEGKATGEEAGVGEPPLPPPPKKGGAEMPDGEGRRELDKLANNVPDSGRVAEYMSKETIEKYTGETPTNDQRRGVQELQIALEHGEKIIEKAQTVFGTDYVDKTLAYIEQSTAPVSNRALMYVSLENALGREKLLSPERAADITKQQAMVYAQSQKFARENSLALNYQKLRKIAQVGYDIEKITNNFFSPDELIGKKKIEEAIEADADAINKEAESQVVDKSSQVPPVEEKKGSYQEKAKKVADTFRKLKTKPFKFKDENGNEYDVTKMGFSWNDLVELGAKAIEKTGEIADGIKAVLGRVKESDFYKGLSEKDRDRFLLSVEDNYKSVLENTPEAKRIKQLEKKLDDLRQGIVKSRKEPIDSPRIQEIQEEIFEAKRNLGLINSKNVKSSPHQLKITETERKIARLEKEKEDLENGIIKQRTVNSEKPSPAQQEKINTLKDEIFEAKKELGLIKSKPVKESTPQMPKNVVEEKKRLDKLQKELDDLRIGIIKQRAEKLPDTPESSRLKELIFEEKKNLGLVGSKMPKPEFKESVNDTVKNALIEKGFGREIIVNGEKKTILDWKKLAGRIMSPDKIRETVQDVMKKDGYPQSQIDSMKDALVEESISLRDSIIQKAQNELARRNKENITAEQKSAARKLAEMYTYGAFEKGVNEFDVALNKALGAKVSEQGYNEAKEIAKALENLYTSTFKGVKLNDVSAKAAIEKLEDRMRVLLFREARKQGNTNLRLATFVRNYFEIQQTMILNNMKQAFENPFSGLQQNVISKIEGLTSKEGIGTKEMAAQRKKLMADVYRDMVLKGGVGYGKVEATFVNRQHLDDFINKLSDSQLYHGIASVATGKTTLNAMDAMWKASLTEKKFAGNLIKVLTHETNKNKMSKEDAQKFVSEKLTGQTFKDAQETAVKVIEKINKDAGKELIPTHKEQVDRFANDIVKAALEMGGKLTPEQIEAAYNAAYRSAGLGLGHTANNFLSAMIHSQSAKIEGNINQAIRNKQWDRAALLTYYSVFYRNILNPFVGGGTNWLVLKFEKTGLGLFTGLAYKWGTKTQIDMTTERGLKEMEQSLYNQSRIKDNFMRGIIGGITTWGAYAAFLGLANTDEYKKWRGRNPWAARYLDIVTPEPLLAHMAAESGTVKKYVSQSFNKNDAFDASTKVIKAADYFSKGKSNEGWGALGEAVGSKLNLPLPWRLVKDNQVIYQGIKGQDPYHGNYKPSTGFMNGVLQGGAIEWLGFRPEGSGATPSSGSTKQYRTQNRQQRQNRQNQRQ